MTQPRPLPLAEAASSLALEVKKMQTVGHLRFTARDIAGVMFNVNSETAEVVALQNAFERALNNFVEAMRSPAAAIGYTAPDSTRAYLTAKGVAAQAEINGQSDHDSSVGE
jgi:hypothetical protein